MKNIYRMALLVLAVICAAVFCLGGIIFGIVSIVPLYIAGGVMAFWLEMVQPDKRPRLKQEIGEQPFWSIVAFAILGTPNLILHAFPTERSDRIPWFN